MSSQPNDRVHPVTDFALRLGGRLGELVATPVWSMTPDEQREALVLIDRDKNQLEALRLRVLGEAERSGATDAHGAGSAADWVAVETRQVRGAARSDLKLAQSLEQHRTLATACEKGEVNPAQARAITTALDRLPNEGTFAVTTEQVAQAEDYLVELAASHDAKDLTILGRKLFEVIAPQLADEFEGKLLSDQEARAARRVRLSMREDEAGTCHGTFRISALHGQLLKAMLQAITNPARTTETDKTAATDDSVDPAQAQSREPAQVRDGQAFCELLERIPAKALPRHGGILQVVVLLDYDKLISGLGAAALSTGGHISAGEARRLACRHGLIPAVLDGKSRVLDVGRKRRFLTDAMLLALTIEQRHCTAVGCDMPAAMCHGHHEVAWGAHGVTSAKNGRLLCGHHHRRIHDQRFITTHHAGGKVSFHRRT